MKKRKLTDDEVKVTIRNIEILKEKIKDLEYYRKYNELMIDSGLEVNLKEQKRKFKKQLNEVMTEQNSMRATIKIAEDQVENGVEIKEEKKK